MISNRNKENYLKRKRRIRTRISGTSERPRLSVFRSARHIYAQVIDDRSQITLVTASSLEKDVKAATKGKKKTEVAEHIGQLIAERCLAEEIKAVVFDRNGFIFHGRVAKLADAARAKGLTF